MSVSWLLKGFAILAISLNYAWAQDEAPVIALSKLVKSPAKLAKEYIKLQEQFSKKVCKPNVEEKYWELYRDFRGDGHYIPVLGDGKLDRLTVSRFVPEIEQKIAWIQALKEDLKKRKGFSDVDVALKILRTKLDDSLRLKHKIYAEKNPRNQVMLTVESKYAMIALKDAFKSLIAKIPFLLSYKFPVDHFQLRENYDEVKHSEVPKEIQRKNEVYFFRKIVQDGAQNPNTGGSDGFLRAVLDTLSLELEKAPDILSETMRHDLDWSIRAVDGHLARYGREKILQRLDEWEERTKRELEFYIALKNDRVRSGNHFETSLEILTRKEKARYLLKDYVLSKQKEVYEFWSKQSPLNQAIFSLETILFNEVGRFDGSLALERRDVAQVVINRVLLPHYNQLTEKDSLFSYLSEHHRKHQAEYPWLNVMLKEGEFSFTYFFITGSVRIFCPERTRTGKALIRENVNLALEMLAKPNFDFKALRYFSRASMLGRISMDKLWPNYQAIAERPGRLVVNNAARYNKIFKQGEKTFLYHFVSPQGIEYQVYVLEGEEVVYEPKSKQFYTYRSPHYFKYFQPVTTVSSH